MSPAAGSGGGDAGRTEVRIDRLALRVAGLDEDAARQLARLVARGLAAGTFLPAGAGTLDSLAVQVQAGADGQASPDLLARRIVGEIGRVLARDRAFGGPDGEAAP
jgi:hypothetical protein